MFKIEYPQEEQGEEQRRHGGENHVGSVSDRRHEKLQSEKDGVIQIIEGNEGYRKIIEMISETGDEEYGKQCFKAELHEKSGLDNDQMNVLESGIRWRLKQEEKKEASNKSNGGKAGKGSNWRQQEEKDGSGKGKRRQEVKKMNTGNGKEMTDKDQKKKQLKVITIRARKTGDICWSRKDWEQTRKEGEGTSELEFWRTSKVAWIWTGSLGR